MSQYWNVVSFDTEEYYHDGKLGEFLFSDLSDLILLLAWPKIHPATPEQLKEWILISTSRVDGKPTGKAPLLSLPNELLLEIFEHLPSAPDAMSFGLITERVWRVGENYIVLLLQRKLAPWARTRLICLGDRIPPGDFPPGFFLEAKHAKWLKVVEGDSEGDSERSEATPMTLADLAYSFIRAHSSFPRIRFQAHEQLKKTRREYIPDPKPLANLNQSLGRWTEAGGWPYRDSQQHLVLRNLTKKVYVRGASTPISLGAVVVAHICWSADPDVSMAYDNGIHRGVWAGDRFDACPTGYHEAELAKLDDETRASWKDVSDDVAVEMEAIWRTQFGDDWEEHLGVVYRDD